MSSELFKEINGADEFQQSLDQIRDGHHDCEEFFEDALRRLEATLGEAVREQQAWDEQRTKTQSDLDERAAELQRQQEQLQSQRDRFLDETLGAAMKRLEEHVQQQLQHRLAELSEGNGPDACAAVSESEARLSGMLKEAADQRQAIGEALAASVAREEQLEKLREQHDGMLQGRSELEAEVETLRQRAAELIAALEEQKNAAAAQRNQWTEELRRQRQMLELLLQKTSELESFAASSKAKEAVSAAAGGDSALSSVLSQFEVLQRDVARRRNKPSD